MTEWIMELKKLFLGDQDSVTGHHRQGYTLHVVEVAVFPAGTSFTFPVAGKSYLNTCTGYTQYNIVEGDVITPDNTRYFEVTGTQDWPENSPEFRVLTLQKLDVFPFLSGFFGFEDEEHGTIGYGFEEGFERGYWAL